MAQRRVTTRTRSFPGGRFAVVVSRYNASVTDRLLAGAKEAAAELGIKAENLTVLEAAGAFEVVGIASAAARTGRFEGVLALGCIIKGETRHDEFLGHAVTTGLANVGVMTGVPVGLGVLTVNNAEQALARAGGEQGNKGYEAMHALVATAEVCRGLAAGDGPVIRGRRAMTSPDKLMGRRRAAATGKGRS